MSRLLGGNWAARLNLGQRLGANGRAKLEEASPDPIDVSIKRGRLTAIELSNEKARAEALAISGRYVEADAMRPGGRPHRRRHDRRL